MALTDLLPPYGNQSTAFPKSNVLNVLPNSRGYLDTLANKFLLKPASARGLAGWVFDYEAETEIIAQAEITDHYSETNTFRNDHAAQRPQVVRLRGFVGEVMLNPSNGILGALNVLQSKLTTLPALLGKYTPGALQGIQRGVSKATSVVNQIDNTIGRIQNTVGLLIGSSPAPTKQQMAYQQLYALYANNTVFTLETPFNYFPSMMIERLILTQPEETKQWAELEVVVKEVRFMGSDLSGGLTPQLAYQKLAGRAAQQGQGQTNQGKTGGFFAPITNMFSSFGHRSVGLQ